MSFREEIEKAKKETNHIINKKLSRVIRSKEEILNEIIEGKAILREGLSINSREINGAIEALEWVLGIKDEISF